MKSHARLTTPNHCQLKVLIYARSSNIKDQGVPSIDDQFANCERHLEEIGIKNALIERIAGTHPLTETGFPPDA